MARPRPPPRHALLRWLVTQKHKKNVTSAKSALCPTKILLLGSQKDYKCFVSQKVLADYPLKCSQKVLQ